MPDKLEGSRKRGLTPKKASKILHEGLKSAGNGFHSEKQRRYMGFIAHGGIPVRTRSSRRRSKRGT